jgi:hypothetical protein
MSFLEMISKKSVKEKSRFCFVLYFGGTEVWVEYLVFAAKAILLNKPITTWAMFITPKHASLLTSASYLSFVVIFFVKRNFRAINFIFFLRQYWGLNSGLHTCATLPSPFVLDIFLNRILLLCPGQLRLWSYYLTFRK